MSKKLCGLPLNMNVTATKDAELKSAKQSSAREQDSIQSSGKFHIKEVLYW